MDLEENLPCFRSSRPSRTFRAIARSCMSRRIRSRMYSLGVAYTSLSLARSSTYLRRASVNWTLRLLLKLWHSEKTSWDGYILSAITIDINRCQRGRAMRGYIRVDTKALDDRDHRPEAQKRRARNIDAADRAPAETQRWLHECPAAHKERIIPDDMATTT